MAVRTTDLRARRGAAWLGMALPGSGLAAQRVGRRVWVPGRLRIRSGAARDDVHGEGRDNSFVIPDETGPDPGSGRDPARVKHVWLCHGPGTQDPIQPCVYILASRRNGTLYTGVTGDLVRRVALHRAASVGFCARYGVHRLAYFELHGGMEEAIVRDDGRSSFSLYINSLAVIPGDTGLDPGTARDPEPTSMKRVGEGSTFGARVAPRGRPRNGCRGQQKRTAVPDRPLAVTRRPYGLAPTPPSTPPPRSRRRRWPPSRRR